MTMHPMPNPYEQAQRERKVTALCLEAQTRAIDAQLAERLDSAGRRALALLAGVKPASDETWAQFVETLRHREIREHVRTELTADPFARFPRNT